MKITVLCNSKTGFTKRYADWIAEELHGKEMQCDVQPYKDFSTTMVEASGLVIFCSRIHAGKVEHLHKVKSHFCGQSPQKLIVVATGGTPAAAEGAIAKVWAKNLTESELQSIPHFYLQGGLDYEKMGFLDRTIMKTVAKLLGGRKKKSEFEAGFEQAIQGSYDIASREYTAPLIDHILQKAKK